MTTTNRPISTRVTTRWVPGEGGCEGGGGRGRGFCPHKDTYTNWSLRLYWKALAAMKRSLHDVMVLEGRRRRRREGKREAKEEVEEKEEEGREEEEH